MDYFKENFPDELRNFFLDEKYRLEILELVKQKGKLKDRLKVLNTKRMKTWDEIAKVFAIDQNLQEQKALTVKDLEEKTCKGREDIKKIEEYFEKWELTKDIHASFVQVSASSGVFVNDDIQMY